MNHALLSIVGVLLGSAAGAASWRWLRQGRYRMEDDEPRLPLGWTWLVLPATALAGGLVGAGSWSWFTPAAWLWVFGGVLLTWIDLDVHRVPDRVLRWWAPSLAVLLLAGGAVAEQWSALGRTALGGLGLGVAFLVLALVGSMGLGDVKLAAVTGMVLAAAGWSAVLLGVVTAFAAAAVVGIVLLARGATRRTHLAFGPALIVGGFASLLATSFAWRA